MSFGTVIKDIGKMSLNIVDGKYIVEALLWTEKAAAVLGTVIKEQPDLKATLTELVSKAEAIGADIVADAAGKGLNLAADAKTLADVEEFFSWFTTTVVPLIESVYGELKTDISGASTS